ncbi:hypothetical protein [Halobacteriovorax sp. JY17]|uniref:hypothetical protein n=1 Tax=Halobacteriovorax sp. JY17 TaxID=2014617 RepID=UPI000C5DEE59|nr:hypothetical protein [Halobacteriovorax sp. JY17]PIK16431.1 MAG: hypothetical protein CES88_06735 [Halobacteriovorax sp. JY17]
MNKLICIVLVITLNTAFSNEHNHSKDSKEHDHSISSGKVKDLGAKKFIPTEDLKIRMEKILNLVKKNKKNKDNKTEVKKVGKAISLVISDIFKTCKLEPDADEAIHPVLAGILTGSSAFEKGDYKTGLSRIHESLLDYEKLFSHEEWKH